MAWQDDLIDLLENVAGFTLATDLFATTHSTVPRLVGSGTIQITETVAGPPERTQNSVVRPAYVHVGAQLRARADSPTLAYITARRAYDAVVGIRNVRIGPTPSGATFYRELNPLSEPIDLNVDTHDQPSYVFTIHGIKEYSAGD